MIALAITQQILKKKSTIFNYIQDFLVKMYSYFGSLLHFSEKLSLSFPASKIIRGKRREAGRLEDQSSDVIQSFEKITLHILQDFTGHFSKVVFLSVGQSQLVFTIADLALTTRKPLEPIHLHE